MCRTTRNGSKFVDIAAYNVGIAHVYDAIKLWQKKYNLDPSAGTAMWKRPYL